MSYEQHLHHLARRHHATMQKVVVLQEKITTYTSRAANLIEVGAGAWLGGLMEGRTGGRATVPLLLGGTLLLIGYVGDNDHGVNLGNGLISSYLATAGYEFGQRWQSTGKFLGA